MSHNIFGKKLNRDTGQRQALLKGLAGALIRSEAIETTQAKATAAKGLIEKLISQAKRANLNDIRDIEAILIDKGLIHKLVHDIAPRFSHRAGGYLRLIKLGNRIGDNAPMVRMELVEEKAAVAKVETKAAPVAAAPISQKPVVKKVVKSKPKTTKKASPKASK